VEGFNPYQPPAHSDVPPAPVVGAPGEPLDWDIETALSVGWDRTKQWWPVLVFGPAIIMVGNWVISFAMIELGLRGLDSLISLFLGAFFGVGLIRMFLSAVRTEEPRLEQLVGGADRMWALLATEILMGLAILAGLILLVIPGLVLACGLAMAPCICVDQKLGPIDSLKASWAMMRESKLKLVGFGLVAWVVMLVGVLALVVGMFVAIAVVYAAGAWIYLRVRGEEVPRRAADRLGQFG
jgi:uncharacterized membrane protein